MSPKPKLMNSILFAIAATAAAMPVKAAELATRFDRVSLGLTGTAVLAIMETPPSSIETVVTLGVPVIHMRWLQSPNGPAFVVTLVLDRVAQTRSCDRSAAC